MKEVIAISEEQAEEKAVGNWAVILFFIGLILGSILMYKYVIPSDWIRWLRLTLTISSGFILGGVLAFFARFIRYLVLTLVLLGGVGGVIMAIVEYLEYK